LFGSLAEGHATPESDLAEKGTDRHVIEDKLERLRRCVQRIEQKRLSTPEALATDYDLQDILSVNLERAVQLCVDIAAHIIADREVSAPTTMAAAFEALHTLHVLSSDLYWLWTGRSEPFSGGYTHHPCPKLSLTL
jgi:hypothetical protein